MALTILIRTQLNSIPVLDATCYTKANYGVGPANTTLSVNTPRGVLGGSVATISADYTAFPGDGIKMPLGLFVNDAAGAAFENAPAVASGKVAIIKGLASVEVDVYETTAIGGGAVPYAVGAPLYGSAQGFLSTEPTGLGGIGSSVVVGIVTKVPTTASPTLGLDMRI